MRVLVYTPIRAGHLYGRAFQSTLRLEWDGQLDFMLARGGNDHTTDEASDRNEGYIEVTRKYLEARNLALVGGYDALLCAESDMILPPDALVKLARVDADVAYGLYSLRHGDNRWCAFSVVHDKQGVSLSVDAWTRKQTWGRCVEVAGVGMGCTLIHRRVLEALPFHVDQTGFACCDWYFALDCQARGFKQMCDLSVVCGHMTMKPMPRILWPEPTKGVRIELLDVRLEPIAPGETREYIVGTDMLIVPGAAQR